MITVTKKYIEFLFFCAFSLSFCNAKCQFEQACFWMLPRIDSFCHEAARKISYILNPPKKYKKN